MALPKFSFVTNVSTNINICQITAPFPPTAQQNIPGENTSPMLDLVSYYISVGSTGVGTIVTFQELGPDGNWRALVNPGPITTASSTNYQNVINGPFHGLRIAISSVAGNGIAFAELKGSMRTQ